MDGAEQVKVKQAQDQTAAFECPLSPLSIKYTDVSSERIQPSLLAKNIGVIFYQHLSLNQHVTSFCKSCFFHLRSITKIRDCSSTTDTEIS